MFKHCARLMLFSFLVMAIVVAGAPSAFAASFPCEKAKSPIEKTICGSAELSNLDEYLGRYYEGARGGLRAGEACLVDDQRAWIRKTRDACRDAACLKRVYLDRLAVLHAVQPGVSALRNIELPKLPSLVWIVPPAADQVAAPRNTPTVPLVATGKLVNDVAGGDGYVLQTKAGAKVLIAPLMFLEQSTTDAFASFAHEPNALYEAHGRRDAKDSKADAFSSGQCIFIYRKTP